MIANALCSEKRLLPDLARIFNGSQKRQRCYRPRPRHAHQPAADSIRLCNSQHLPIYVGPCLVVLHWFISVNYQARTVVI